MDIDCTDNYTHPNPHIFYFSKSFPTKEVEKSIKPTSLFCQCTTTCSKETNCACMRHSGTTYKFSDINNPETYTLCFKNINRPTYECNEQCQCEKFCGNKLAQLGPRGGLLVKTCDDPRKGQGLYSENFIKQGGFVCEYAGEVISEKEASTRFKINANLKRINYIFCADEYFGDRNVKTFIDPTFYGNIGRYLNHSCDPNCVMVITRINDSIPVLSLFASRDINSGEELCYDYGIADRSDSLEAGDNRTKCLCNMEKCRGFLPYDSRIM